MTSVVQPFCQLFTHVLFQAQPELQGLSALSNGSQSQQPNFVGHTETSPDRWTCS